MSKKSGALAHLTAHYNNSDEESETESVVSEGDSPVNNVPTPESLDNDKCNNSASGKRSKNQSPVDLDHVTEHERPVSPISFHRSLQGKSLEEISVPLPAAEEPPENLVEKVKAMYEKTVNGGQDIKKRIESNKNFRNPSIYEKLVSFLDIDELGSNFPPEIFDPHKWGPESFYDELGRQQKELMETILKQRKERTKVEIISGTKTKKSDEQAVERKKTKWDNPPNPPVPVPSLSTGINPSILGSSQSISNPKVSRKT